ncbi:hypothetical protein RA11412_0258 [Rothia aeria]|uniref:Uncharacterized protein n=1 Tax=Rothia aeria TaxID=172042 RepID=A0A2Z5QVX5_9MICC|nr:hypothetical protein RA11412_0258 [Rothia aeria]
MPQLLKLRHRVYLAVFTMLLPAGGAAACRCRGRNITRFVAVPHEA